MKKMTLYLAAIGAVFGLSAALYLVGFGGTSEQNLESPDSPDRVDSNAVGSADMGSGTEPTTTDLKDSNQTRGSAIAPYSQGTSKVMNSQLAPPSEDPLRLEVNDQARSAALLKVQKKLASLAERKDLSIQEAVEAMDELQNLNEVPPEVVASLNQMRPLLSQIQVIQEVSNKITNIDNAAQGRSLTAEEESSRKELVNKLQELRDHMTGKHRLIESSQAR